MAIQQTSAVTGKTATIQDRELDNAIRDIEALNNQVGPSPTTPDIQEVLDSGNSTDKELVFTNGTLSLNVNPERITGVNGFFNQFEIDVESGIAYFQRFEDSEGPLRPEVQITQVSSAQILAMGDVPIVLLPPPEQSDEYYDVEKVILKYTFDTAAYSSERLNVFGAFNVITESSLMGTDSVVCVVNSSTTAVFDDAGDLFQEAKAVLPNSGLSLSTYSGNNPTTGNGTLEVIVFYRLRIF